MGNYLSFPLLCISNIATMFLSFGSEEAWRLIRGRLVVVNGDDIVFKSSRSEEWKAALPLSGFVVNNTKTSVHPDLFTLNSKLFRVGKKRVRKIWHLIPKGVFKRTNTEKESDWMAAHAAVVRENVKGMCHKTKARTIRALMSVKKTSYKKTSVKRMAASSYFEYQCWPKEMKVAERIKAWECAFSPLKEKVKGERLERISRKDATDEEIRQSPYVAALARFNKCLREVVVESNDRDITKWDWDGATFFMYQKDPSYARREEEWIWVTSKRVVVTDLEFI